MVPINPSEQARFQRQLIATARSMKRKQQELHTHQNTLNDKWIKVLEAEAELKTRRTTAKSFPKRRLLPDFDDEAADDELLTHGNAGQADRPVEGKTGQQGQTKNPLQKPAIMARVHSNSMSLSICVTRYRPIKPLFDPYMDHRIMRPPA